MATHMAGSEILAIGAPELSAVLIALFVIVVPIATIAFARSGRGYAEIGKGRFAVDFDENNEADHEEEVRQMVEAKAYRQARRGDRPVDIEREISRLLQGDSLPGDTADGETGTSRPPEEAAIRAEVRQVVIARNERRERQGEPPLDVEAEVERMLAEFG